MTCIYIRITCPACGAVTTGDLCVGGRLPAGAKQHLEEELSRQSLCGKCRHSDWPATMTKEHLEETMTPLLIKNITEGLKLACTSRDPRSIRAALAVAVDDALALEKIDRHLGRPIQAESRSMLASFQLYQQAYDRLGEAKKMPDGISRVTQVSPIPEESPEPGTE